MTKLKPKPERTSNYFLKRGFNYALGYSTPGNGTINVHRKKSKKEDDIETTVKKMQEFTQTSFEYDDGAPTLDDE